MANRSGHYKDILWVFVFFGALAVLFRMTYGLGATTNLTDSVPRGLWKIFNMGAGVALSTSGFTIGFLVIVLKMERFRPLLRPAILLAFLGYGSSVTALFFDIGLPLRIWHPIVMWNPRSFLFEVAICVMCYFTVTILELFPTVAERSRFAPVGKALHKVSPGIVIVGISLSSLHHSSLGSLFLVTPTRLHPLWFTPLLPVLFILSAIGAGMMAVVLVRILYARYYHPDPVFGAPTCAVDGSGEGEAPGGAMPMLSRLASIAAAVLTVYLGVQLYHLVTSGAIQSFRNGDWESILYVVELLTLSVIPLLVILHPKGRRSPLGLGVASGSAVFGLVMNRVDVGIFGYFRDAKAVYFPSLAEWALSLGLLAAAALVFFFVAENFSVFDEDYIERRLYRRRFHPIFDRLTGVWQTTLANRFQRVTFVAVITIPIAFGVLYPPYSAATEHSPDLVSPPLGKDKGRNILEIDGNRENESTVFDHKDHINRFGGDESCEKCHHLAMPRDNATPCWRCHLEMSRATNIFQHEKHFGYVAADKKLAGIVPENQACTVCHEGGDANSKENAKPCLDCHEKDMAPTKTPDGPFALAWAVGYRDAMHGTCISCHKKEGARQNKPALAECATCHPQDR